MKKIQFNPDEGNAFCTEHVTPEIALVVSSKGIRQQTYSMIPILIAMILFSSCTMEKRVYRPGFHTEWHHSTDRAKKQQETAERLDNLITEEIAVHHVQDTTCTSSSEMDRSGFASPARKLITTDRSVVIPRPIKFVQKMDPSIQKEKKEKTIAPPEYSLTYNTPVNGMTTAPLKYYRANNDISDFLVEGLEGFLGFLLLIFVVMVVIIIVLLIIAIL